MALPIAGVTLRGLLGRRRSVLMLLLVALPVVVGLIIRLAGGRLEPDRILDTLIVRTVLPLVALVFGTAALGSEIEDGTAVFLMTKPIERWRIALAKMAVAAGLTIVLLVPATILTGVLNAGLATGALQVTFAYAVAIGLGGVAYACAFVALSSLTSRALVVGLGYILIWEGVLAGLLEGTRFLSVRQATLGIASALSGPGRPGSPETLDAPTSILIVMVVIVGSFLLATWRLRRFEIRGGE